MDYIILTNPEKCVKCMSCVRTCEVNANMVKEDYIDTVQDMCIVCGACIEACPEGARNYLKQLDVFKTWLTHENVVALLAPSYVAHYDEPYKFVSALKKIGVKHVYEVALGAELASIVIADEIRSGKHVIASPCSTVVNYIKKWIPELIDYLSQAVSPMIATARYVKKKISYAKIVFIGPCISKKSEILHDEFDDLYGLSYPIIGGLAKTVSYYLRKDVDLILGKDTVVIEGKSKMTKFLEKYLKNIKDGNEDENPVLTELLYCDGGCIGGPGIRDDLEIFEKRKRVIDYTLDKLNDSNKRDELEKLADQLDLKREYKAERVDYRIPSEDEINEILRKIGMLEKPLNCGSCGYHTCRDRAIAVLNDLMPWDLCIQYQLRLVEREHKRRINRIREEAIERTKNVVNKQMLVAQKISSLLGETTAETKASLLKLLKMVMSEAGDEEK